MAIVIKVDTPKFDKRYTTPVDGYTMFRWPEFIAFAKRLGVPLELPLKELAFVMREGECVEFCLSIRGSDLDAVAAADATTTHNEKFRTKVPAVKEEDKKPWPEAGGESLIGIPGITMEEEKAKRGREFI